MKLAVWVLCALLVVALATPPSAGELKYANGQMDWTVTGCSKPAPPALSNADSDALNRSVNRYAAYVGEINGYTACLSQEAEQDMRRINDIILAKMRAAQKEALREADDLRVQLFTRTE